MGQRVTPYMKMKTACLFALSLLTMLFFSANCTAQEAEQSTGIRQNQVRKRVGQLRAQAITNRDKAPPEALKYCREALKILKTTPVMELKIQVWNEMCWIYKNLGEYGQAMTWGEKSIAAAKKINFTTGLAEAHKNVGVVCTRLNQYSMAFRHCASALALFEKNGNSSQVANIYNNMGIIYSELGDNEKTLEYYLKSLQMYEEIGDKGGIATAYNNVGTLYATLSKHKQALDFYNKALNINKELGRLKAMAYSLNSIGKVYLVLEDYDGALMNYNRALKLFEKSNHKWGFADNLNCIGEFYIKLKEYHRAMTHCSRARDMFEQLGDRWAVTKVLINIGIIYRKINRHKESLKNLRQALTISRELNTRSQVRDGCKELSLTYAAMKDYKTSLEYHRQFKQVNDEIFNKESRKKFVDSEVKYNTAKKEKEIEILKKDKEIQRLALEKQRNIKNSLLVISLLILLLILLLYSRYKVKHKMASELLKSRKMESIGILAGGIAHDFNNLLVVIKGSMNLLRKKIMTTDKIPESKNGPNMPLVGSVLFKNLDKATSQAVDLAQKLVTFSSGGWLMKQKVTVAHILKTSVDYLPEKTKREYDVSLPPGTGPLFLYVDERQFRQAIQALLTNAAEADPHMRPISIQVQTIDITAGKTIYPLKNGNYAKILIKDDGAGIPKDKLEHIFDPYFSTKENFDRKGLGLGLAMCYSIIKKHDGHIIIESEEGKGTTVQVFAP
ncbi:MAG: tetratricopeptide repeat protein, partial [bacterium]|nr:tetratricopeptide repeat protein [bacterium]